MSGLSTIKGRSQNITRGFAKTSSMNQTTLLQALGTQRVQSNCDGDSSPNTSEKGQGVCQAVLQRQRETQALSLHTPWAPVIRQQTVLCCALSHAPRFATPWSVACQGPLSMAFSSSLPGSSVHGILQASIQEWVAISSSRRPS